VWATLVLGGVALALGAIGWVRLDRAAGAGSRGKDALLRAEQSLRERDVDGARASLREAGAAFDEMSRQVDGLGPLATVGRLVPLVRVQVRGTEAFADAGALTAEAGLRLVDTAEQLLEPADPSATIATALDSLRALRSSLRGSVEALDVAAAKVAALDGYRLVGPLDDARRELARRLPEVGRRAAGADADLGALMTFLGGDGPRRYLLFSQNPDEVRPTGGYLGTFGLLVADGSTVALERYGGSEQWRAAHPDALVAPEEAPTAFDVPEPPVPQSIANVNAEADWPGAARLAMRLWEQGGEEPVDGAVSVTPEFLARLVGVLGPVEVPAYGETVTEANLVERADYYTHGAGRPPPGSGLDRKDFLVDLATAVVPRLLAAPSSSWDALATANGAGFDAREAMAWTADDGVARSLQRHGWDGTLPATEGDFFFEGDFEFAAKNGRDIRRTYDHRVELRQDGSGRVTTTVTIANGQAPGPEATDSLSYITLYGPSGAVLDEAASDPIEEREPARGGHPAAGWVRGAAPQDATTLTVTWDVPELLRRDEGGSWSYELTWMPLPGHQGDIVNLAVTLPEGWRWAGDPPPQQVVLGDRALEGAWALDP